MPLIKDAVKRERNAQRIYGCSEARALELNDGRALRVAGTPASRYAYQRQSAFKRSIAWEISFPEWVAVWNGSGVAHLRGVGVGKYCMARQNDVGPYSVGNVSIQLCTQNNRDGIKKANFTQLSRKRVAISLTGRGRGWSFTGRGKRPYQVMVGRRYVGSYSTQDEAESAYAAAVQEHVLAVDHGETNDLFICPPKVRNCAQPS